MPEGYVKVTKAPWKTKSIMLLACIKKLKHAQRK